MVVVAGLTLVGGCGLGSTSSESETVTVTSSSSSSPSQETRTETATETATAASSSTTGSDPTSAPAGDALPTDVEGYADAFVRAWGIGDREDASRYATAAAVRDLFGMDTRGGSGWARKESIEQGTRTQVRYTDANDENSTVYVLVDRSSAQAGEEDAVVGASYEYELDGTDDGYDPGEESAGVSDITVPETSVGDYCDTLVRAWGAGKRTTADKYATSTAMTELFDDHGTGGSGWSRSSTDSYSATYTNTDGSTLTLYINSISVSNGWGDGVFAATFS